MFTLAIFDQYLAISQKKVQDRDTVTMKRLIGIVCALLIHAIFSDLE